MNDDLLPEVLSQKLKECDYQHWCNYFKKFIHQSYESEVAFAIEEIEQQKAMLKEQRKKGNGYMSQFHKKAIEHCERFVRENTLKKNNNTVNEATELSISEIALLQHYLGVIVTRNNANSIVKKHGRNSGDKLYNEFSRWRSRANRLGRPTNHTQKTLQNKIELFTNVIGCLPIDKQQQAKDELLILERYKTDFE